jgi:hypothetical protein
MGRCCKNGNRKPIGMELKRSELLYDIKNYAYVEGEVMDEAKAGHERHQVQDVGEAGNVDRVTRVLDLAHAECLEALYPYTKVEIVPETVRNDALKEERVYCIHMMVPVDFSQTTANLILKSVHEYMVYRVMEDWLSITNPQASAKWKLKAEEMKENMREAISMRGGRVRRTLTPW